MGITLTHPRRIPNGISPTPNPYCVTVVPIFRRFEISKTHWLGETLIECDFPIPPEIEHSGFGVSRRNPPFLYGIPQGDVEEHSGDSVSFVSAMPKHAKEKAVD